MLCNTKIANIRAALLATEVNNNSATARTRVTCGKAATCFDFRTPYFGVSTCEFVFTVTVKNLDSFMMKT